MPLGETNIEFYRHIYTGQRNSYHSQTSQDDGERVEVDGPRWPCHICTFRNHPLMNKCEQCEMPRILLGNLNNNLSATSQNSSNQLALGMNS